MFTRQRRYLLVWRRHSESARIPDFTGANPDSHDNTQPYFHIDTDPDQYQYTYYHANAYNAAKPDANSNPTSKARWKR